MVAAAQEQKQKFETSLLNQARALREAQDELEAQKVAHEALKAEVALQQQTADSAKRSVAEGTSREQELRTEVAEQQEKIAALAATNRGLLKTQSRVLAQDALQHLSMTMIERSISVRGLFERLDVAHAGWLTRDDFVNGLQTAFPALGARTQVRVGWVCMGVYGCVR